jgi:ADP-ribose pyrophosphatase
MKKPADIDSHLAEEQVESSVVFSGTLLHVRKDKVSLPNGAYATREFVVHPGAAMIVPRLNDGRFLVERQFRYPCRQVFIEFPAGKRDPGESSVTTALRELEEETGYRARRLAFLAPIHNAIAYSDERIDLFLADDLVRTAQKLDAHEFVELTDMSLDEMLLAIRSGLITDVKTIIGVMWMEKITSGQWPVKWLDLQAI